MPRKVRILVLGDPGPVRHELLIRRDLEVFWTNKVDELGALIRHAKPEVALISADIPGEPVEAALAIVEAASVPSVVLAGPQIEAVGVLALRGASIVSAQKTDAVLALVAAHTGLQLAKDARAKIEALVRAYVGDEEYVLETANLSVSGVAIRNFPECAPGTMVHVEIELPGVTVLAEAKVVRFDDDGGRKVAGLTFVRIARAQRERIQRAVENARREAAKPDARVEELFGDLTLDIGRQEALETSDIQHTFDLTMKMDELLVETELSQLGAWAQFGLWSTDAEPYLQALEKELTAIERAALRTKPVPEWVMPALRMRICLARARHHGAALADDEATADLDQTGRKKLPSAVADEAYRMFVSLGELGHGLEDSVIAQVAKIRAALLRDLLAGGPRPRAGAMIAGGEAQREEAPKAETRHLRVLRARA